MCVVGAVVQRCWELVGDEVAGEVELEEVFEVADCGREVLGGGGDVFAGEEEPGDGAAGAANLRPVARRRR